MTLPVVALYARVSTEQQATTTSITTELQALRDRVQADGLTVSHEFIDEGWSVETVSRPGPERLRDLAAMGGLDRLYVVSPVRLARKHAYQVLLPEEWDELGVSVIVLADPPAKTPETALLHQLQGMIAEYERAQITERTRRGKRALAQQGAVRVLGDAPFGYRYVAKGRAGARVM